MGTKKKILAKLAKFGEVDWTPNEEELAELVELLNDIKDDVR